MRLLISCIPFDGGKSGISVYMRNFVAAAKRAGCEITVVIEPEAAAEFAGFDRIEAPACCKSALMSILWHLFILPWRIPRGKFDALIIAAANRRMVAWKRHLYTVGVVHDLSQYHVENKYDTFRTFYIKHILPFFVRRADLTVAISDSTKHDLVEFWHLDPAKIVRSYNGLSLSPAGRDVWGREHNLEPGSYILYLARLEHPGKNHLNLIKAYEKLPSELKQKFQLVMPGASWGNSEVIFDYVAKSPDRERILFPGFVGNEDLASVYQNAAMYVFPSFFEGFGLPLIEAMHHQVPCATAYTSSLGELGRGAALLFDPSEPGEITAAMQRILTDGELRRQLISAGQKRAAEFNWDDHFRIIEERMAK